MSYTEPEEAWAVFFQRGTIARDRHPRGMANDTKNSLERAMDAHNEEPLVEIQNRVESHITSQPGVQGVGVGLVGDRPGLRIFVAPGSVSDEQRRQIEAYIRARSDIGDFPIAWDEGDDIVPYVAQVP